jgi:hypothetical protein
MATTEGFQQADLAGALGYGDEHDVHDADSADAERHRADDSEQKVECSAELHDVGRVGDCIPTGNGLVVLRIEVMPPCEDCAHGLERLDVQFRSARLEDDAVGITLIAK